MYSSPPIHGATIVVQVLSDAQLYGLWRQELAGMAHRILDMRTALKQALLEVRFLFCRTVVFCRSVSRSPSQRSMLVQPCRNLHGASLCGS
jgi:aspartate/tyrosine/aromatic aminotransferase